MERKGVMLETRVNVLYCVDSQQNEYLFESLMLHLRSMGIRIIADGRTSTWKSSRIQGINIFLEHDSDLKKTAQAIKDFFIARTDHLQLRPWENEGRNVKVIIKGAINYHENPLPDSDLEYIIE